MRAVRLTQNRNREPSRCRNCGQTIIWRRDKNMQRYPVEPEKVNVITDFGAHIKADRLHTDVCRRGKGNP